MTKSELFTKAHEITRAIRQAGDDYRATFGLVLRSLLTMSCYFGRFIKLPEISKDRESLYNRAMHIGRGRDFNSEIKAFADGFEQEVKQARLDLTQEQRLAAGDSLTVMLSKYVEFFGKEINQAINNPSWFVTGRDGRKAKEWKSNFDILDQIEAYKRETFAKLRKLAPQDEKDKKELVTLAREVGMSVNHLGDLIRNNSQALLKDDRKVLGSKTAKRLAKMIEIDSAMTIDFIKKLDQHNQELGGLKSVFGQRSSVAKLVAEFI